VYQNDTNAPNKATLAEYRSGTAVDETTVTFSELPLEWGRVAGDTNWYNVGETSLTETYVSKPEGEAEQQNDVIGTVGVEQGKGPELANHQFTASVKAGDGAGSLELESGSIGVRIFGDVDAIVRAKTFNFTLDYTGAAGEYEPIGAIRVDPGSVGSDGAGVESEPIQYGPDDDLDLALQLFDPSNVQDGTGSPLTDANYGTPEPLNPTNSVLEFSKDVEQVPDQPGRYNRRRRVPAGIKQVGER